MLVPIITAPDEGARLITGLLHHWSPAITWALIVDPGALSALEAEPAALVLDTALSWASSQHLLEALGQQFPGSPVVMLVDALDARAASWMGAGVAGVARRDDPAGLAIAVASAVERARPARRAGPPRQPEQPPSPGAATLSDELYEVFVSQSADGIWCFSLEPPLPLALPLDEQIAHAYRHAVLVECNDAMARMYGHTRAADLIGMRLDQFLTPADPRNTAYLRAFFQSSYRLSKAESFEQDRDGNERIFENSLIGTVVGQQLVRAWGIQRDITAQVREQRAQQLRASAGALLATSLDYGSTLVSVGQLLVPTFADYILVNTLEPDGTLRQRAARHWDPAQQPLLERLGAFAGSLAGRPGAVVTQVLRSGRAVLEPELLARQVAAGGGERELRTIYERLGPCSTLVVPLRARGQTLGVVTLSRAQGRQSFDASDLALGEELAHRCAIALDNATLYAEAEAAIHARDELLTVASHELRTPLTAIIGFTAVLRRRIARDGLLSERDLQALGVIAKQSMRMERLIALVLDEARLRAGRLELARAPVDMVALARRVAAQLEPGLERHRITLEAPGAPLVVQGDELRLEQVLEHLLLNAVKYSPAGGVIVVAVRQAGAEARIEVRDAGIGIPAADLPRVGERFFRARNALQRQLSGTGVGLYVAGGILAAHQGRLEVASVEGQGTTVRVCLPLAAGDEGQAGGNTDPR